MLSDKELEYMMFYMSAIISLKMGINYIMSNVENVVGKQIWSLDLFRLPKVANIYCLADIIYKRISNGKIIDCKSYLEI